MPPPIKGYHEIAMTVSDLERSEKFFCEVLGMRVLFRIPNQCVIMMMGDPPHRFLGLWLPDAHASLAGQGIAKMHFTMEIDIDGVDAWEKHFKDHGVHAPKRIKENGDVHFDFDDPDGHPLELWARTGEQLAGMPDSEVPSENRHLFHSLE
ncbi:MAG: VOC family protein [Candidatus Poribacteria bacterium]|nr:VOC family protein [Candidatus Poribacteria bacterium]